jgi:hypothetical protein
LSAWTRETERIEKQEHGEKKEQKKKHAKMRASNVKKGMGNELAEKGQTTRCFESEQQQERERGIGGVVGS